MAAMPQGDKQYKMRPVLLLKKMPYFDDFLVCGISSKLHQKVEGFDLVLLKQDPLFPETGLEHDCLIKTGFLMTISSSLIEGVVGTLPEKIIDQINGILITHLKSS